MTFTTLQFAIFMVALFFVYYIVPKKIQWMVLLSGNIVFYYFVGVKGLVFLLCVMLVTYGLALFINRLKDKGRLAIMAFSVILFAGLLSVMRLGFSSYIQPVGLSYYALMCLGYVISVYWGMAEPEKNPLKLMLFVSYFPHIIQGPFDDYNEMKSQLFTPHVFDYEKAVKGIIRIAYGLMKKLVLADRIGNIVNNVYESPQEYRGFTVIMCVCLYAFQLYADFSGYMDMAIGCSQLFGIDIKENFNVPFLSKSMEEFWRRWHMSLGVWFKNYVFYTVQRTPLVSNISKSLKKNGHKKAMRIVPSVMGLTVVWTLIGLWHGFDWNYLIYDWACGLIIILSTILKPVYDKVNELKFAKSKISDCLRVVRTFILVALTFVIFRPDTVGDSLTILGNMFKGPDIYKAAEYVYWNAYDFFLIAPAFIILIVVDILKYRQLDIAEKLHKMNPVIRYAIYIVGLVYIYVARHSGESVGFAYSIF